MFDHLKRILSLSGAGVGGLGRKKYSPPYITPPLSPSYTPLTSPYTSLWGELLFLKKTKSLGVRQAEEVSAVIVYDSPSLVQVLST